jgi:hypothetical protein
MTFTEFKDKYLAGTLDTDPAWRGYDIMAAIKPNHTQKALKLLKLTYAGELAIPEFCARYPDVPREQASRLLAAYWLWALIDSQRAYPRVPKRKAPSRAA